MNENLFVPRIGDCWNRIGVYGDRTCPELDTFNHCRNCSIYSSAGRALLEQPLKQNELTETARALSAPAEKHNQNQLSVLLFQLNDVRFALPLKSLREVSSVHAIHTVPHITNREFLGLASLQGEIVLCFSLHACLDIAPVTEQKAKEDMQLILLQDKEDTWAFRADHIEGVEVILQNEMQSAPDTITHAPSACTTATFSWKKHTYALLNGSTLCSRFRECISA